MNMSNVEKEAITQFIYDNSNQDGLDLTKLYFGKLNYYKDEKINPVEQALTDKITIVYLVHNDEYMDLFKEKRILATTYQISGLLSFAPMIRTGLSIKDLVRLSDILNIERLPIEEIQNLYNKIEKMNYDDFFKTVLVEVNQFYTSKPNIKSISKIK